MIVQTDKSMIAKCRSFLGWWRIWTGSEFRALPADQQIAVLQHELAHVKLWHTEQRILCLLTLPFLIYPLCRWQEFQADKEATRCGAGPALLQLLTIPKEGSKSHPSNAARCTRIALELSSLRTNSPGAT